MLKGILQTVTMSLACCIVAFASQKSVHWSELEQNVGGKTIIVKSKDGQRIQGKVLAVKTDQLVLRTRKGDQAIARPAVQEVLVPRHTGVKWRILGAAIGSGIGVVAAAPILAETHNEGSGRYDGAAIGLIGGLAAAGYLAGWSVDREHDVIRVLPD